mgnify:CR=1 FL=1
MGDVWVSLYELEAADSLNARSVRRFFEGALVRIGPGFGCLHPWPELGDPTLEECLADLMGPRKFGIVKRTVAELQRIDFLEDPVRFQSGEWEVLAEATGLSMANDRHQEEDDHRSEVLVMKPAVEVLRPGDQRVVVTSAMDHPLGQCFAAREAARFGCREVCGLQTHGLFRESVFSEVLGEGCEG